MDTKEKVGQTPPTRRRQPAKKPARKPSAASRVPKREEKEPPRPLQDVVYTPPKPFMRNRVLLRLVTVAAIVLALVLAMAVFFRVEHIQVSGMEKYSAWDISEASGIDKGDSFFSFEMFGAAARIQQKLDYVKSVRIGIRLPNMVHIEITEIQVTYAVKDQSDQWWLVESGGRVIEKLADDSEIKHTKVLGVHLQNPEKGKQATALENTDPELDENGNPIPVTVTAAHRLSVALSVATYLEANGIIGEAASIDVNDLGNIQFWYGEQYQVKLGDEKDLSHKMSLVKAAITQLSEESHNSGVLDASLTVDKTGVRYTRFQ